MRKLNMICLMLATTFISQLNFAQTDDSGREKITRLTHTKATELIHTKLNVSFDFQKEQLLGEEWLTARPYFYASNELVLDAKAMIIKEVSLEGNGKRMPLKFSYKEDQLKIELNKTYTKADAYTVYINYVARPNEVKEKGSQAITDSKGLYFINPRGEDPNKPTQIWTQGETQASSCWFPTIDQPNQKTTQEIDMTVPSQFVTLSNGILKSSEKKAGDLRTDHWVMDKKHSPYLFFMAVGEFAIIKDKWRNIAVDYYVEPEYKDYAQQIFGNTPEMIEFFSKKMNYDYPWSKYAQIVGRDYVSGAMENTTAVLHQASAQQKPGQLIDENIWENTIAHELFHHWFGDLVTAESWSNLTVNESFANYSEYLWLEYKYGKDAADYHLTNDLSSYLKSGRDHGKNLVRFDYESREDMFDLVSYQKGGGILHMLRNYLGDSAFFAGLSDYLKTNEYATGEAHQLRLSLEKVSGKDLTWFFDQWYYNNSHPILDIKYTYEPVKNQLLVDVTQTQDERKFFQFPFAIDVYENGVAKRHNVWVNATKNSKFIIDYKVKPELVVANADQVLLCKITEDKTLEQYFMQYQKAKEYKSRQIALAKAIDAMNTNNTALKTVISALDDPFFELKRDALKVLDLSNDKHAKLALAKVEKMSQSDSKTLVQADAILALSKTKNTKYLPQFEKGLNAVSNAVKANSFLAIMTVAPDRVSSLLDKIDLKEAGEEIIMKMLPIIVTNKITKQMPYIAQIVAFYPFIGMQKPELAQPAREGFEWIMGSDSPEATAKVLNSIEQVKPQLGSNVMAKKMMTDVLQKALEKKKEILKLNPSPALEKQVEMINKSVKFYE